MFVFVLLCITFFFHSSFTIILKRKLVAFLLLSRFLIFAPLLTFIPSGSDFLTCKVIRTLFSYNLTSLSNTPYHMSYLVSIIRTNFFVLSF